MVPHPHFLMTAPGHFEVSYQINPWMRPELWRLYPAERSAAAQRASEALRSALEAAGAEIELLPGEPGLPDLVFTANAAVVLDRRVLLAHFRHPERRGEEPIYRTAFERLKARGVIDDIREPPPGIFQEGAGDAIWDASRQLFWAGTGPRSDPAAAAIIAATFRQAVTSLELACERFYHLDTCFCPLSGGEVAYYPPAFTPAALAAIHDRVAEPLRIELDAAEANAFGANAVNLGSQVIMAKAPRSLRSRLKARGYEIIEVDLAPFILAGGAAYCLTLRLDRASAADHARPVRRP